MVVDRGGEGEKGHQKCHWRELLRAKLLQLNGEECALRPTDESIHHQQRLARRLQVANLVLNSWTSSGRDPSGVAQRHVDGSLETLQNFVTEVAEEESRPSLQEEGGKEGPLIRRKSDIGDVRYRHMYYV